MHLYHCILIGASILSICSSESATNYPVSSHPYNRGDDSLHYKYNLDIYTTSKPNTKNKGLSQNLSQLPNYQNIQYAPLPLRIPEEQSSQVSTPKEEVHREELDTEANTTFVYDNEKKDGTDSKRGLEPNIVLDSQIITEDSNTRPRKYVPGYNVDLKAVNNKLTQNGFYASNPNFLVKNKQVNVNFLQPQATFQNQGDIQGAHKNRENKLKPGYSALTYQYDKAVKKYNENTNSGDKQNLKRPSFYVKAPKVALNLARAHHIARTVHKASVNVNSNFKKLPSRPEEFFSNPQMLRPSKTQLYPVHNSKLYIVRRTA